MSVNPYSPKPVPVETTLREEDGGRRRVMINTAENALLWLRKRKGADGAPLLSDAQFAAGEKLREDYTIGMMGARVTQNWSAEIISGSRGRSAAGGFEASERALAARQRVARALEAVGPELSGILMDICCLSAGVEQAERRLNLPQRSGKAVLALALQSLARHYGLVAAARTLDLRHAAVQDYRPVITPRSTPRPS